MSPGPHHFDFPGFSATLPARKGSSASLCHRPSRLSDVTPPPINRNLKPNRKCEFLTAKSSLMWRLWFWFLLIAIFGVKSPTKSALLIVVFFFFFTKTMTFVDTAWSCFPQRSQHLLIWRTMGSLMSCHLRAQSPCPGHGPCESHINHSGWFIQGHSCTHSLMVQIGAVFWFCLRSEGRGTHIPVCFASGPLWTPCPPSTVDPFLHKASPAPTRQTARRIMWLWWVPIAGGEMGGGTLCSLF